MRIGTRGSRLALWQAQAVAEALTAAGHGPCEIVIFRTSGDRLQPRITADGRESLDIPLSAEGGKRLFVREIEEALLGRAVDIAVHSAKDMPADLPPGLAIGGVLPREDPRDAVVLPVRPEARDRRPGDRNGAAIGAASASEPWQAVGVGPHGKGIEDAWLTLGVPPSLGFGEPGRSDSGGRGPQRKERKVGTGSIRRVAQLRTTWPDARFEPVRGNVDTRLRKLDEGQYDALVLAAAGLRRLGFGDRISALIPLDRCVPAPGQGTIAIEVRADDARARDAAAALNHAATAAALDAERAVVEEIGGGCQLPLGAVAIAADGALELHAVVIAPDGSRVARASVRGPALHPRDLGRRAVEELTAAGAREILDGLGIRR
ncbi:MAG: hydroxymethylbilane synthase [Vicinamibacterales bacterium]